MLDKLEKVILSAWYKKNLSWWLWFFLPFTILYIFISFLIRKFTTAQRAKIPCIVIGNLTVGGTGKTPLTLALAKELAIRGKKVGILTRAYGNRLKEKQKFKAQDTCKDVFPHLLSPEDSVSEIGDEAMLFSHEVNQFVENHNASSIHVMIDPNRLRGVNALADMGVEVAICDDGLQHWALKGDISILLVDFHRSFGNGWQIPMGPLREKNSQLSRFDAVVLRDVGGAKGQTQIKHERVYSMNITHKSMVDIFSSKHIALAQFKEIFFDEIDRKKLLAVAAIGNTSRFFSSLKQEGIISDISSQSKSFGDHYVYKPSDLPDDKVVIMTQKDAVKCIPFIKEGNKYFYVSIDIDVDLHFIEWIFGKLERS